MWVPGLCGLAMAAYVMVAVHDRPTDCGFPPVDAPPPGTKAVAAAANGSANSSNGGSSNDTGSGKADAAGRQDGGRA